MLATKRNRVRHRVADLQAALEHSKRALESEKTALVACDKAVSSAEAALVALQSIAEATQQKAQAQIAAVVSRCLEAVFDDPYEFVIDFEQKRNQTEAVLTFVRNGEAVDPMSSSGGGVVDIASFALRISCLLLSRPAVRRTVILDEPFKFVSEEYRGRVRELLEALSGELGVQFIMVTHIKEIVTGNIIQI